MAQPGEFTLRAFAHGKMDLAQAEAVADLVDAHSKTSHDLALNQMRGAYSSKIKSLRKQLLDFTSLIELELDFSEEDVEFANREKLQALLREIKQELTQLIASFSMGNAIKKGIPVTIIGEPNVGKSTLLNALLNEERAIVSEIPGTTRDAVEDNLVIDGYTFRFIDTAGLRQTEDHVESIGIDRTYEKIKQARIVLFVFDITQTTCEEVKEKLKEFDHEIQHQEKTFILIGNKTDELVRTPHYFNELVNMDVIFVSAKRKENINLVIQKIVEAVQIGEIGDATIVSNSRHYQELKKTLEAIEAVKKGFDNDIPTDLIAIDIHTALHHLGEITGEITTDEILGNIFGKFCIGK
jgi:tRNA modification GTPase